MNNLQNIEGQPPLGGQPIEGGIGQELSQEEMMSNLQGLAGKIDEKYQDFNSQKFASKNRLDTRKRDALKEVFNVMLEKGINLENPEDVRNFLDTLRETNPELYQIVEGSLEKIFAVESDIQEQTESPIGMDGETEILPETPDRGALVGNEGVN